MLTRAWTDRPGCRCRSSDADARGIGSPGGSLSVIDLLVAIAFGRLRHDPRRPDWPERDRIVLSKGHAVPRSTA